MRIGINTLFLVPGDVGGTEVYLRRNLQPMIANNPNEKFLLFTSRDNHDLLFEDVGQFANTEFVQIPLKSSIRPIRILAEQTLLPLKILQNPIDVLWSPGYTAPLLTNCRQVVTIHDMQYKTNPEDLSNLERFTLDFLVNGACKRCDRIIAVSEFSKKEIIRFTSATEEKIEVVYEGVDPSFSIRSEIDVTTLVNLPPYTPFILCVAHTYPHKQVHLLVEAFGKIQDTIPHHLILVGKARRGEQQVQDALSQVDGRHKIHRISGLQYQQLQALYQQADLFVLPSKYEGFGLPVLEAMLAGTPVVTTPYGSLPEVGGDFVEYVEGNNSEAFAKKIIDVLEHPESDQSEQTGKAINWSRTFTWENSATKTLEVLRSP